MLGDIAEDKVCGDRRYLVEPRLAELSLNVIFASETEAAVKLDAGIRRLPRSLGSEVLRHVGLGCAGQMSVVATACLKAHQIGRLDFDIALSDGKLHALILADGPTEHHALFRVIRHLVDKPVPI